MAIALERKDIHPIGRYIFNSGFVEGWALYAERLAEEMKLYSSDLDRLGMLSGQAFAPQGWWWTPAFTRWGGHASRRSDYMLAHTAEAADDIAAEVDRYIVLAGTGHGLHARMIEIRAARDGHNRRWARNSRSRRFTIGFSKTALSPLRS